MRIGIGIDTGGTYTDAVVYDFASKSILGSAKAPTTRADLSIGILGALDGLPRDIIQKAEVVSLSTTLATNAAVEGKGGRAKLIFFGGDKRVIDPNGPQYGLPPSRDICIQDCETTISGAILREPDWDGFLRDIETGFDGLDGVGIVEVHAMRNGAVIEKKAKELFATKHDTPVTCGHELFSELNSLQRGSSTLLNASLFPIIKEFLDAIKTSLAQRGIRATLIIVRSDGSLMSEEFATVRPVETLLCGPAASVIGGTRFSDSPNCIVVDMGGTTTDIAIVKGGIPISTPDGVNIGKWKTFVNGLYVRTIGLGGDSAVHYVDGKLRLEEYRVVPLCVVAEKYPVIVENLRELAREATTTSRQAHEHYLLVKDISASPRYNNAEKAFCAILRERPLPLLEASRVIGKSKVSMAHLLREGVVQLCGLTPTDIMHIRGDFTRYGSEASKFAAEHVAFNLETTADELCTRVYDEVKRKIYGNILFALLENQDPYYRKNGVHKDVEHLIDQSCKMAKTAMECGSLLPLSSVFGIDAPHENGTPSVEKLESGGKPHALQNGRLGSELLSIKFRTDFSLIGIGAPIHIFLDDVARMLGTRAVVPQFAGVANALGAVMGNVCATHVVEIKANYNLGGITGYTVFGNEESKTFKKRREAEEFAISEAKREAHTEAIRRGAQGDITVTCDLEESNAHARGLALDLGGFAKARAVGAIGFGVG